MSQTDRQTDGQTDRQTESDAYEPTVQFAQVGSKILLKCDLSDFQFRQNLQFYKAKSLADCKSLIKALILDAVRMLGYKNASVN